MDKILYDKNFFKALIKDSATYYAHLPKEGKKQSPELLSEHSSLTFTYSCKIIQNQSLGACISKLIESSIPPCISNRQHAHVEIQKLFETAIAFHDLGKLNWDFQHRVMKNNRCTDLKTCRHPFGSQHSVLSMYLYLAMSLYGILKDEDQETQMFLYGTAVYFSYNIVQHHSSMLLEAQNEIIWMTTGSVNYHPISTY